jgi:Uma2 family endonuclease
MSASSSVREIEYPESDGKPMGESDLHRNWMVRIIDLLSTRYRGQRVYVSGDLLVYYEEGNPKKFVVPDAFVVLDSDPGMRRVYKLWEEGRAPDVVFETTSRSTRRRDESVKPLQYQLMGVKEYFLYDPTQDYLKPPLQGHRLEAEGFARIEADARGALESRALGLLLRLEGTELVMHDARTGERLQTEAEAEASAREAAETRANAEAQARQAEAKARQAEAKARMAAEAELERLRRKLEERGKP